MALPGSIDWFDSLRIEIILEHRAFDDFSQACRALARLRDDPPAPADVAGTALFQYGVISYCKPFNSQKGGRPAYPTTSLQLDADFDIGLHTELIKARNKVFAHGDAEFSSAYVGYNNLSDEATTACSVAAELWALDGIDASDPKSEAILKHTNSAYKTAGRNLDRMLADFGRYSLVYEDEFSALPPGTVNVKNLTFAGMTDDIFGTRQVTSQEIISRGHRLPSA